AKYRSRATRGIKCKRQGASPPVVARCLCRCHVTGRLAPFRWWAIGCRFVIRTQSASLRTAARQIPLTRNSRNKMLAAGRKPSGRRTMSVPLGCHQTACAVPLVRNWLALAAWLLGAHAMEERQGDRAEGED